jgi:hypothetical protein
MQFALSPVEKISFSDKVLQWIGGASPILDGPNMALAAAS